MSEQAYVICTKYKNVYIFMSFCINLRKTVKYSLLKMCNEKKNETIKLKKIIEKFSYLF